MEVLHQPVPSLLMGVRSASEGFILDFHHPDHTHSLPSSAIVSFNAEVKLECQAASCPVAFQTAAAGSATALIGQVR